jgi:ubiquitin C-terminal hydrolase
MRPAYKRYLIATPPPILVIHLKRFQQLSKSGVMSFSSAGGFKKLDDYVQFPEHLDLTPFLAPKKEAYGLGKKSRTGIVQEERCKYCLYAVVVHIGNMLGGHYIAYVALPPSASTDTSSISSLPSPASSQDEKTAAPTKRMWAYISDTTVHLTTLEEVLKAKAYICMYERV